ncbi:MAG: hypothetical protein ACTSYD_04105 [Candidatus Heimdallarchaeaceae archaeon]
MLDVDLTKKQLRVVKAVKSQIKKHNYTTINRIAEEAETTRLTVDRVLALLKSMDIVQLEPVGRVRLIKRGKKWYRIKSLLNQRS